MVRDLLDDGWSVRIPCRRVCPYKDRISGAEYFLVDLTEDIPDELLDGAQGVIHCAAETMGGKVEHERNTIAATENIARAAKDVGIKAFIHISSIAVLKPGVQGSSDLLNEDTPVDFDNLERGPYVWAKAESERMVSRLNGASGGASSRVMCRSVSETRKTPTNAAATPAVKPREDRIRVLIFSVSKALSKGAFDLLTMSLIKARLAKSCSGFATPSVPSNARSDRANSHRRPRWRPTPATSGLTGHGLGHGSLSPRSRPSLSGC